jgi:hypothetical protein
MSTDQQSIGARRRVVQVDCRVVADPDQAAVLKEATNRVFNDACTALEMWNADICTREQKNAKLLIARGTVPTSVKQAFDEQKALCDFVATSVRPKCSQCAMMTL